MIESLTVTNFYCFKERTTILFTAKKERNRMLDNNFCGFTTQNKINILKLVFLLGNNGTAYRRQRQMCIRDRSYCPNS